jgi:hypothetical protein
MDLLAHNIVKSVLTEYSKVQSYSDVGLVETTFNIDTSEEWTSKTLFRTVFKRPEFFRFDRRFKLAHESRPEISMVVWFDGKNGYRSDIDGKIERVLSGPLFRKPKQEVLEDCLSSCSLFTGKLTQLVHSLLFTELQERSYLKIRTWKSIPTTDGLSDHCLENGPVSVFVDRETSLIKAVMDRDIEKNSLRKTIVSNIEVDGEIDLAVFDSKKIKTQLYNDSILADFRKTIGPLTVLRQKNGGEL